MSNKVILIKGKKRAGKDTTAKILKEFLADLTLTVEIMSFADPMKQIIATTFGITKEQLESYKNDEDLLYVEDSFEYFDITDFRQILQRFGTEAMKPIFGDDVWVELTKKKIKESKADIVIIPDWRFPIEYYGLLGEGLKIQSIEVRNNRAEIANDTHSSENALDDFKCDFIVENHGTLEDLEEQIKG